MKNKYVWLGIGAVVLVLAIWLITKNRNKEVEQNNSATNSQDSSQNSTQNDTNTSTAGENKIPVKTNSPSYATALTKYGTNRIQIQQNCQAVPNNVTYKNGTTVMLDNRASIAHTLKIDSKVITIPAYDFTTFTFSYTNLPHTILMDCDKSQNVATILIQK